MRAGEPWFGSNDDHCNTGVDTAKLVGAVLFVAILVYVGLRRQKAAMAWVVTVWESLEGLGDAACHFVVSRQLVPYHPFRARRSQLPSGLGHLVAVFL